MKTFILTLCLVCNSLFAYIGFCTAFSTSSSSIDATGSKNIPTTETSQTVKKIISDFEPRKYDPPFWARNGHINTIFGSGEVQEKLSGKHTIPDYTRRFFETPDGDFLAVDFLEAATPSDRTVVVLHGLESASDAPLPSKMALAYQAAGFNVAVMLFRGCGGLQNKTPFGYHVGECSAAQ
mmetsp:Transcript_30464/g.49667  ORF Transcript_30464/g.49667 Transcript_30464/m.49667 type:complete len:180 (+) Transcript_30464:140-679(+)